MYFKLAIYVMKVFKKVPNNGTMPDLVPKTF